MVTLRRRVKRWGYSQLLKQCFRLSSALGTNWIFIRRRSGKKWPEVRRQRRAETDDLSHKFILVFFGGKQLFGRCVVFANTAGLTEISLTSYRVDLVFSSHVISLIFIGCERHMMGRYPGNTLRGRKMNYNYWLGDYSWWARCIRIKPQRRLVYPMAKQRKSYNIYYVKMHQLKVVLYDEQGFLWRYAPVRRTGTFFEEKKKMFNVIFEGIIYLRTCTFLEV